MRKRLRTFSKSSVQFKVPFRRSAACTGVGVDELTWGFLFDLHRQSVQTVNHLLVDGFLVEREEHRSRLQDLDVHWKVLLRDLNSISLPLPDQSIEFLKDGIRIGGILDGVVRLEELPDRRFLMLYPFGRVLLDVHDHECNELYSA